MSSVTQKMGFESKLKGSSFFTDSYDNGFYDGNVNFTAILYKIGAVIFNSNVEKFIIEGATKLFGELDFNYNQFTEESDPRGNLSFIIDIYRLFKNTSKHVWSYDDRLYFGKAILNTKIGSLDKKKMFLRYEGAQIFDLPNENIGGSFLRDFFLGSNIVKTISPKVKSMGFSIYIPYDNDSKTGSVLKPNWKYLQKNAAIILTGLDLEALLLIIELFENGFVDSRIIFNLRKNLKKHIKREVLDDKSKINRKLILGTIPLSYYNLFTTNELNRFYYNILGESFVTGIDETIILKIIKNFSNRKDFNETKFLSNLLNNKVKGQIEFLRLYDKMNDWGGEDNFSSLIIQLYKIWYLSDFNNAKNKLYSTFEVPTQITYTQGKFLGFRYDAFDFSFDDNGNIKLKEEPFTYDSIHEYIAGEVIQYISEGELYHAFQPIKLIGLDERKNGNIILEESVDVPAFYLKAFDDKGAWENFEKTAWLVLDLITTASGVVNLLKLRYLLSLRSTYVYLKLTYGIIEVTSGVLSIALSFVDNCEDKKLCAALEQYLFWVEIATLGADSFSSKVLKKQAQEAKEALDLYRRKKGSRRNTDEWNEFEEHLDQISRIEDTVGPKRVYKPLVFDDLFGFVALYNVSKLAFFYLENLLKPNTRTVFIRGVEVFTGSKTQVNTILRKAEKVFENDGITGVDDFFEEIGSKLSRRRLHSQTGELYIGTLISKKQGGQYIYELEDFQYHTKKNWNKYDKDFDNRFESFVSLVVNPDTGRKTILYADLYIPKSLNDALQANKVDGLTDISLGKAMLNDGLAKARRDLGKDVDGIYGEWIKSTLVYGDYGGESVNLTKLKEAMKGKDITKENLKNAAFQTVTGKWAKSKGFKNVEIQTDVASFRNLKDISNLEEFIVIFKK